MAAFVLGSAILGETVLGASNVETFANFQKVQPYIYKDGEWRKAIAYITQIITVPENAIVDINNEPILTSDGQFILVDENTEGLTAEYSYKEWMPHLAHINIEEIDANVIYAGVNQPVYYNSGNKIYYKK